MLEDKNNTNEFFELSITETRHYLTPFAFTLDKKLLGLPLASPTKRGFAILIDLAVIALISDVSGVFLAFAIAVTLYYLGKNKRGLENITKKGRKRRAIMRFLAAFILFVVLLDTLPPLMKYISDNESNHQVQLDGNSLSLTESIALGAITLATTQAIEKSQCETFDCWKKQLNIIAIDMAKISYEGDINLTSNQRNEVFMGIGQAVDLPLSEQLQIVSAMEKSYQQAIATLEEAEIRHLSDEAIVTLMENGSNNNTLVKNNDKEKLKADHEKQPETNEPLADIKNDGVYSIVGWVKGLIKDLGLGFGWATLYFTAFTSLWQGQTIGKKLLGIKVLQLDGTPLSMWDSFGRYGGYGAGLATGLLGFLQIYWDVNKQAIHDKISSTVVIDLKAARLNASAP